MSNPTWSQREVLALILEVRSHYSEEIFPPIGEAHAKKDGCSPPHWTTTRPPDSWSAAGARVACDAILSRLGELGG